MVKYRSEYEQENSIANLDLEAKHLKKIIIVLWVILVGLVVYKIIGGR